MPRAGRPGAIVSFFRFLEFAPFHPGKIYPRFRATIPPEIMEKVQPCQEY